MRSLFVRAAAVALALVALPRGAEAGTFLPAYTGYTVIGAGGPGTPNPTGATDGVINFAVYHNVGGSGNWATDLGINPSLLTSGANTTAQYVYFYSVVNTLGPNNPNSSSSDATLFNLSVDTLNHSDSAGVVSGYAFRDAPGAGGVVGPVGNQYLGTNASNAGSDFYGDGSPSYQLTDDGFPVGNISLTASTAAQAAIMVSSTSINPITGAMSTLFTFSLAPNQFSTLVFVTSNEPPGYGTASSQGVLGSPGVVSGSAGDVPVPTPEPGTFALLGLGLPLLGWGYARRARAAKAAAEIA